MITVSSHVKEEATVFRLYPLQRVSPLINNRIHSSYTTYISKKKLNSLQLKIAVGLEILLPFHHEQPEC